MTNLNDDGFDEIDVPPHLLEKTMERLEDSGLVAPDKVEIPQGLLQSVMERFESEGLIKPAAGLVKSRRSFYTAAAFFLWGIFLGTVLGYLLKPEAVVRQVVTVEKTIEKPVEKIIPQVIERAIPPPVLKVTSATLIDRWSGAENRWEPVPADCELVPATLLRRRGALGWMEVDGQSLTLGRGIHVVTSAPGIEPVPDALDAGLPAGQTAAHNPDASDPEALIPSLLQNWATGSAADRAVAQAGLTQLWRQFGNPDAGLMAQLCLLKARELKEPPADFRGWEDWWRRVRKNQEK